MSQYIGMKQLPGGTVTATDDRILYDINLSNGVIKGCEISYTGNNMIHINAGYGVIKGGLFEMQDHTEYVPLSEDGNLNGQIYIHLDLAAEDKISIVCDTASTLHTLVQNEDCNYENGVYEIQLCTYTATTTALENVTQTWEEAHGSVDVLDSLASIMSNTRTGVSAGALAVKELNSNLVANATQFIFDYQDGKFGYNTDAERGADTFHPFSTGFPLTYLICLHGSENVAHCAHIIKIENTELDISVKPYNTANWCDGYIRWNYPGDGSATISVLQRCKVDGTIREVGYSWRLSGYTTFGGYSYKIEPV